MVFDCLWVVVDVFEVVVVGCGVFRGGSSILLPSNTVHYKIIEGKRAPNEPSPLEGQ